jgi:hypothetical protein
LAVAIIGEAHLVAVFQTTAMQRRLGPLLDEWICSSQLWKSAEIAVRRPEDLYAMMEAQRRHPGVVDLGPDDVAAAQKSIQRIVVPGSLNE